MPIALGRRLPRLHTPLSAAAAARRVEDGSVRVHTNKRVRGRKRHRLRQRLRRSARLWKSVAGGGPDVARHFFKRAMQWRTSVTSTATSVYILISANSHAFKEGFRSGDGRSLWQRVAGDALQAVSLWHLKSSVSVVGIQIRRYLYGILCVYARIVTVLCGSTTRSTSISQGLSRHFVACSTDAARGIRGVITSDGLSDSINQSAMQRNWNAS